MAYAKIFGICLFLVIFPPAATSKSPAIASYTVKSSSPVLNRSRSYITFQTNEGDTPKSAVGLQHGSWLDPGRGSAKVSWGFNPRLCLLFPVVCEYYAATATPKDSFFSHSSGCKRTHSAFIQVRSIRCRALLFALLQT